MEKTKQEQEELLARARREIGAERDRAVAELRREAVDLFLLAAASKLIEKRLDGDTDRKLVQEFIATPGRPAVRSGHHRPQLRRNALRAAESGAGTRQTFAELIDAVAGGGGNDTGGAGGTHVAPGAQVQEARLLSLALEGSPREFVRFLQALVKRGRQRLLREIAMEYQALLDIRHNRVRAGVTLADSADQSLQPRHPGRPQPPAE